MIETIDAGTILEALAYIFIVLAFIIFMAGKAR